MQYELSPKQFAMARKEDVSFFSYHFKVLLKAELIELVKTRPARGGVEHIYRSKPLTFAAAFRLKELPKAFAATRWVQ
jgi:DNA-binding transcriptional ArsR family regulator